MYIYTCVDHPSPFPSPMPPQASHPAPGSTVNGGGPRGPGAPAHPYKTKV